MTMPTILVIDDEDPIRGLLKRILEKNGYFPLLAADAGEARKILEETEVDLILCDVMMPGESGLDLIRSVKKHYPDTGIVMVTAMDDADSAGSALEVGVYGYIVKPFGERQVIITVRNALRMRDLEGRERSHLKELERTVDQRTAELEETNRQLKSNEVELSKRAEELGEFNSALKILLEKREEDKSALEEDVLSRVKKMTLPYLEKLMKSGLNHEQMTLAEIIASHLKEIISPMVNTLSSEYLGLTPAELQVADLIKQGRRTKEIAEILNLSANTVISHRYRIRTKLGLKNRKANLSSHLQSLRR
jgi:DNA-binding NarL/FixJ family response regulator